MSDPSPVLGIDLGTTFCAMAIVDRHGKPSIVANGEGHPTTPSVVHFYDVDTYVVGEEAVKMVVIDPTNIARFIKRSMGEADFTMEFFSRAYTPQELSAIILRKLKVDAEARLGAPIQDAVITVPAYFNSAQRGATAEAGTIAGFNVLSIINEPTAAAIAYGIHRLGTDRRIMVFDLGGGTFDVTIMEIRGSSLKTIASDGNAELGGKDWDDRLLNHVAEQFVARFGVDPRDEPQPFQELYERVLASKISLSSQARVVIPVSFRGHRLLVPMTREEFEGLCVDLVQQCAETCGIVLAKAKLEWRDIDEILPAGGATRMPMIQKMLETVCGKIRRAELNPDECVAAGAALAAVYRHRPEHPARRAPTPRPRPTVDPSPGPNTAPTVDSSSAPTHAMSGILFDPFRQPEPDQEPEPITEPALPDIQTPNLTGIADRFGAWLDPDTFPSGSIRRRHQKVPCAAAHVKQPAPGRPDLCQHTPTSCQPEGPTRGTPGFRERTVISRIRGRWVIGGQVNRPSGQVG